MERLREIAAHVDRRALVEDAIGAAILVAWIWLLPDALAILKALGGGA